MSTEPHVLSAIRRIILALVVLGIVGLLVDLALLEHTGSTTEWIPFPILGAGLVVSLWPAVRPTRASLRVFQGTMLLFVATGLLGLWLHLRGNILLEQEVNPSVRGLALLWRSVRGGVPLIAPAAMVQLGLLGLVFVFRHPMLRGDAATTVPERRS